MNVPECSCKVDLHVHSRYSIVEDGFLQQITQSESYTLPIEIYRAARKQNMDFVTITDHNSINGALEIAHLPGVFIGEEVTVRFPEDGCLVHIVVLRIDEGQHSEIQRLRENIYELLDFLRRENILHFIAHPLSSVNGKLRVNHWEKMLLMFKVFEVINGVQKERDNILLHKILSHLTIERIEELADKHNLMPYGEEPHSKIMVAGSDDHGGLYVARTYTCGTGSTIDTFLDSIRQGSCYAAGRGGSYSTLGHSIYAVGYHFFKQKRRMKLLWKIVDGLLNDERKGKLIEKVLAIKEHTRFNIIPRNLVLSYLIRRFSRHIPLLAAFESIRCLNSNAPTYAVMFPYFFGFFYQNKDRLLARQLEQGYLPSSKPLKLALFTDSIPTADNETVMKDIEGSLQGIDTYPMHVFSCNGRRTSRQGRVTMFSSVTDFPLPFRADIRLHVPSLIDVLNLCEREEFGLLHVLTPGPVGIAGLVAGKILRIPVVASYHIDFIDAMDRSRDDSVFADMVWWYLRWFYRQMDGVIVGPERFPATLRDACVTEDAIYTVPSLDESRFFVDQHSSIEEVVSSLVSVEMLPQLWHLYKKVNRGKIATKVVSSNQMGFSFG